VNFKDYWQEFKNAAKEGWREGTKETQPEEKKKTQQSESTFGLYFSTPIGIGILWALAAEFVNKSLGLWWQDLALTSTLFVLVVSSAEIWNQLHERSKKKKIQKLRSTFAVLVDDQLLAESADINIITFQGAIFQGLFLGVFSSSLFLAILFAIFFGAGINQEVAFYIIGLATASIASMLLLVESRLQAERRTRNSRYYQAATSYYLDRSEEIRRRNSSE